ncbi:conserved hypothetical protein [Histoplasma capsulatum H143]|uniref:Uncharacterized protein n=1 Tax=Ajellomyces capsulatus (strain H143) TaxID=544712 RepID=C6HEX2_AJECH|nr:conserved hypothetical protein [Histoplasma capsulatum H143]
MTKDEQKQGRSIGGSRQFDFGQRRSAAANNVTRISRANYLTGRAMEGEIQCDKGRDTEYPYAPLAEAVSSEQLGGTNVVFHLIPLSQAPWIAAPSCSTSPSEIFAQSFGHRTIVYANSGEGSLKHSWPQMRVQCLFEDRKVEPQLERGVQSHSSMGKKITLANSEAIWESEIRRAVACTRPKTHESVDPCYIDTASIKFNGGGTEAQAAPNFPIVSFSSPFGVFSPPQNTSDIDGPDLVRRDFAILHTKPGENPWDLGSPLENFKEVMGYSFLDWFSPLKNSPCTDHNSQESAFRLGPVVRRLRREAGLESCDDGGELTSHNEAHRNRDRRINGEPNKVLKTPSSHKPRKIEPKARPIQKPPNTHRGKHIRHEQNPSGSFGDNNDSIILSSSTAAASDFQ